MASALSSHHSKNENEQLVSAIHIIFRFAQKLANRVIKLRKNDWGKLEKLALLLKDVSDEERFEIFDAMTEVIFPEEGIGSFIDVKKVTSREAQARSIAYRKKVGQEVRKHRKGLR